MGRTSLPLLLIAGLAACAGEVHPGADRLVSGPRWRPPPAQPRPPEAPGSGDERPGFTPPNAPVRGDPLAPPPAGPGLSEGPLPPAWSDRALAVVARQVSRRVMASERVVGVAALPGDGLLALSEGGGLFRSGDWRPLRAQATPLPPAGFTRLHGWGPHLLACRPEGAWRSADAGLSWQAQPFGCDPDGRSTVAVAGDRLYRLQGDGLVRQGWLQGQAHGRTALPLSHPQAVAAFDQTVVVFGRAGVARSLDGGRTFQRGRRADDGRLAVRAVRFVSKTRAVAVGTAPADGGAALVSADGGFTWRAVPLPRRAEDLRDVAVTAQGGLVAVTGAGAAQAFASDDGGDTWQALGPGAPVARAVAQRRQGGAFAASPRGAARVVGVPALPQTLGLDQPLWAVAVTHPLVAVGAGAGRGLFRTRDGGRTWSAVPGTGGVRFADVTRAAEHRVVAVGDGLLWASEDGGRRWRAAVSPASCEARWARFAGRRGVVACADRRSLRSEDGGATWQVGPVLPGAVGPVAWLDDQHGVAPRLDGLGAAWTVDGGLQWTSRPGPSLVDVQVGGDGWTAMTADGLLFTAAPGTQRWRPLETSPLGPTVAHRWAAGGALVRLGPDEVVRHSAGGDAVRLTRAPGAHGLALTGDGGLWVLQAHATTALAPR